MYITSRRSAVAVCAILLLGAGCRNGANDGAAKDTALAASITPSGAAHEVEVLGLDCSFGMPDSVDAGRTAFKFANNG